LTRNDFGRGVGIAEPPRRHMPRKKSIGTKVTADEYATLERLAEGQTISAWVRDVLLATATSRPADEALLGELLALRTILVNLLFASATGETPSADAMKRLIERADADKLRKAQERLASVCQRRTS
jgi:hypothetical protein